MRDEAFFPPLGPTTLDRALVRRRLRASFESVLPRLDLSRVLDVGSGRQPWRSYVEEAGGHYVGLDLDCYPGSPLPDLRWDGFGMPLRDGWATTALLTEVLEHAPDPGAVLRELSRVMAPGAHLYFTVPFLWPVHDAPHDEHRYTPFALQRLIKQAGLEEIDIWALGGWNASLAQMLGLWARRRPMRRAGRALASVGLYPLVWALDRSDRPTSITENGMMTGIAGIAARPRLLTR